MKHLLVGMITAFALVLSPVMMGCGGECDKHCDKFIKCIKDIGVKGKKMKKMKKDCLKECKTDKEQAKKNLKALCGK